MAEAIACEEGDCLITDWHVPVQKKKKVPVQKKKKGMGMRVGFSGTRQGMTNDQVLQVHMLLGDLRSAGATQATHGMCQGADKQFHDMAKALSYFVIGCPGVTTDGYQYFRSNVECDLVMPEKPFLIRNRNIINESDVILITPKETREQFKGSGTWASIRYARTANKPLVVIWPDGSSLVERVPGVHTAEEYRAHLIAQGQPS